MLLKLHQLVRVRESLICCAHLIAPLPVVKRKCDEDVEKVRSTQVQKAIKTEIHLQVVWN